MAEEKREDFGKVLREKSMEEFTKRMKGKPTPTQDELNRINLGERVELEADGSDPDENAMSAEARHRKESEAKPSGGSGGYQTRQATPAPRKSE